MLTVYNCIFLHLLHPFLQCMNTLSFQMQLSMFLFLIMFHAKTEVCTFHIEARAYMYYTDVHLIESIENCGLCMRRYIACSSHANVMHRKLTNTCTLRYDASVFH